MQRHATRPRVSSSESELSEHIELELLLVEPQLVTGKSTPQQHQVPRTGLRALLSADMMEPDPRAVGRGHENSRGDILSPRGEGSGITGKTATAGIGVRTGCILMAFHLSIF